MALLLGVFMAVGICLPWAGWSEPARAEVYYEKKMLRDREARRAYRSTRQSTNGIDELYMLDIMREGMENGDPRLR